MASGVFDNVQGEFEGAFGASASLGISNKYSPMSFGAGCDSAIPPVVRN